MAEFLTFGQFFRELRLRQGKTLRQFCLEHKFDAGNTSRLERDELQAPIAPEKLREYAEALGLKEGSEGWEQFFDLAAISAGRIPFDVRSDKEIVARLPLVFRTLRNKELDRDQLEQLIDLIRRH